MVGLTWPLLAQVGPGGGREGQFRLHRDYTGKQGTYHGPQATLVLGDTHINTR